MLYIYMHVASDDVEIDCAISDDVENNNVAAAEIMLQEMLKRF